MIFYSFLFFIPFLAVLSTQKLSESLANYFWKIYLIFLFLVIGARYQVGGDWIQYITYFYFDAKNFDIFNLNSIRSEFGYELLTVIAYNLGFSFYFLNFFAAGIFIYGLCKFAIRQPNKWLVFMMATSYLIIVVAMGYTRQSIGFGFLLLALNNFLDNKNFKSIMFIILGSSFHFPCIVFLSIFILNFKFNSKGILFSFIFILSVVFIFFYFQEQFSRLTNYYYYEGDTVSESRGAFVRVSINFIAAVFFLLSYNNLTTNLLEKKLYLYFSLLVIFSMFLLSSNSTLVDRLNIYFMPLQLFVFSRIIYVFRNFFNFTFVIIFIGVFYYFVLLVWLFYSNSSFIWLPYQSVLLDHTSNYDCNINWEQLHIDREIICNY